MHNRQFPVLLLVLAFAASAVAGQGMPDLYGALDSLSAGLATKLTAVGARRIAVAGFTDLYGQTNAISRFIASALTERLVNQTKLEVIDEAVLTSYLETEDLSSMSFIRPEVSGALRRDLKLDYVVAGTVAELESSLVLSVRAISLSSGVIAALVNADARRDRVYDYLSGLPDVAPVTPRHSDRIEGEDLKLKKVTAGTFEIQAPRVSGTQLSGGRQSWWWGAKPGDRLDVFLPVPTGRFRLIAQFCKAFDYGIVQLMLDGRKLGGPIDFYADEVIVSGPMDLGIHTFGPEQHVLSAVITGANPKMHLRGDSNDETKKCIFAVDYVDIERVTSETPRRDAAVPRIEP